MSTVVAIALFLISFVLFKMGFGALRDSTSHSEYGVENESLHKKFSWFLIGLGGVSASIAGVLLAG
jgi:hypothetical protein